MTFRVTLAGKSADVIWQKWCLGGSQLASPAVPTMIDGKMAKIADVTKTERADGSTLLTVLFTVAS